MSRYHRTLPLAALVVVSAVANAQTRMLRSPTVSKTQIAFAYANNIWTVDRAGGIGPPRHELPGHDRESKILARREADRLQRAVRRQRRRLRRARRGRRAKATDLASRRRRRPGLDARRKVDRLRLDARDATRRAARRVSGRCRSKAASKRRWRCRARIRARSRPTGAASRIA